jgi:ribosomal protein S18 acetylase RimI-like enzyme
VEVRRACESDLDAMVEVMYAEPGVEQMAFMPSITGGRRFSAALWRLAGIDEFVVADDEGDVVGFAWLSEEDVSLWTGARAAIAGWGATGPVRLVVKGWPRQLVEIPMPPGPKLIELQVHPARRGAGIGSILLRHVIDLVDDRPLSLGTRSDNPARHLYERNGFRVVSEKSHRSYEKRTGTTGRVLMLRTGR